MPTPPVRGHDPARPDAVGPAVRVLVGDDQEVFRQAASDVIAATPGFELAGEVDNGADVLAAIDRLAPDLVLLDVRMPGLDGVEVARLIAAARPQTVVVLISAEEPADIPFARRSRDAAALVRKRDFGPRLLRRLWSAHGGRGR